MTRSHGIKAHLRRLSLTVAGTAALLLVAAAAQGAPGPVPAPAVPGNTLPGPVVDPGTAPANQQLLKVSPDTVVAGSTVTVSGSGLPANASLALDWSTANVDWQLDPRVDSVDYLGRKATPVTVQIHTVQTDANGSFTLKMSAPRDFGGLHSLYAVANGVQLAKGGLLLARSASIYPKSGPVGTKITVIYQGLGSSLYEGGASLLYDNKYAGALTANWTRGVARVQIRAAGPVGNHTIEVADAISVKYMNIQQSPIPWATGDVFSFKVTKDNGRPAAEIDWPDSVAPTFSASTTLTALSSATADATAPQGTLSFGKASGAVNDSVPVTGTNLPANASVDLVWATVVGSRVNCTSVCWSFVQVPLGSAKTGADGSLKASFKVPDGLGGWHAVQVVQNGQTLAQQPFYMLRSFAAGRGVSRLVLHAGQKFTVHLKGLGWTQLDNTIAVDYDNSYVGYGCGFNSNGDTVMNMVATGAPGTHLIDMYPLLYTQQPSYANTPYGMVPILTYQRDEPGLALGYQLPAMRLAITIVK